MYTSKEDYDCVREIWHSRKQRDAAITVGICTVGFVLMLIGAALWQWIGGVR